MVTDLVLGLVLEKAKPIIRQTCLRMMSHLDQHDVYGVRQSFLKHVIDNCRSRTRQ